MKRFLRLLLMFVVLLQFVSPIIARELTPEEKAKKRQEILELIKKKQAEKAKKEAKLKSSTKSGAAKQDVAAVIAKYESYLKRSCTTSKSNRCADALFSVSKLYYTKAKSDYIKNQEAYEKAMDKYDRNPVGPEPIAPFPNYDKPLNSYLKAIKEYPNSPKVGEAYFQAGSIYMLKGDLDNALKMYLALVEKRPNDMRAAAAHFRIAEIYFNGTETQEKNYTEALKHLNMINDAYVNDAIKEMAHFRKAEIYYNRGDLEKAAELFGDYIDKCDNLIYPKRDLRPEALEYLAVAFSDMDNGAESAIKYFDKHGGRSYEDTVIYAVGFKNYDHGQYDAAVLALGTALKKFPDFQLAPKAQMAIVNSYVIRRKNEEANKAREVLVDTYGKGSAWITKHADDKKTVAIADKNVRDALGQIAVYYHAKAQASREPEKKKEWYAEALKRYNQFIAQYPEDKWKNYEFHYNAAEAYMTLGNFAKAAEYYDFVASADLSTYPKFTQQIDTIGISAEDQEKEKATKKSSPVDISQMDAGFNAIVALDTLRKIKIKEQGLKDSAAYNLPETQKFIAYAEAFQKRFPKSPNAAEVLMLIADVTFNGGDYAKTVTICDNAIQMYGTQGDIFTRAMKLKADAYTESKQYDLAVGIYDTLILKSDKASKEYKKYVNLASGALFLKAQSLDKAGNKSGAANIYMSISNKYPQSDVADKAWFEAAAVYESDSAYEEAAKTFAMLTRKFPKSSLVPKAFGRASEDYVKANQYEKAAAVMELAATTVKDTSFALGALAKSAEYYKKAGNGRKAADLYYLAYKMFPTAKNTPLALYNAGREYEDIKDYAKAIEVYKTLATKYAENSYAAEGYYSIGYCYEKMGDKEKMANAFVDYSKKFTVDRPKQINALLMATDAYIELGKINQAESQVAVALKIYDKFHKKAAIEPEVGAKAYYTYGELNRAKLEKIKLTGKNPKAVQKKLDAKVKALKPVLESYAEAIKQGVEEWTFKSTYAIGMTYVNFASDVANQKLFGNRDQKLAGKIQILSSLDKYYAKAQENFDWIIETAQEQNLTNDYVDSAEVAFMEMGYRKGRLLESVGEIFRDAPIPGGLSSDEEAAYRDALDEKYLTALDAALPKYEEAIDAAKQLHIGKNMWVDSIRSRIEYIDPTDEILLVDLDAEKAKVATANEPSDADKITIKVEKELNKALQEIENIVKSGLPMDQKVSRLNGIELEAKREITKEEALIKEYKDKLGLE